jgi:transcriptional regulator with XRE-family HTH domain
LIIYLSDKKMDHPEMDREHTRRENARHLARQHDGLAEFARRLEMSNSQVSQIIGKNPTKNIGNSIARRIEEAYGVGRGWLDVPHGQPDEAEPDEAVERPAVERPAALTPERPRLTLVTTEELDLLEQYRLSDGPGRDAIRTMAGRTRKRSIEEVLRDQAQSG